MKKFRIAQVGSFDVENYGDLLFSYVFKENIEKYLEDIDITLFAPLNCISPFTKDTQVYSVKEMEKMHSENPFDAIVVGGGDLVQFKKIMVKLADDPDREVVYDVLSMWFIPAMVAMKYQVPIIWNSLGVPFELSDIQQQLMAEVMKQSAYVTVRDESSRENLGKAASALDVKVVTDSILSIAKTVDYKDMQSRFENVYKNLDVEFNKDSYIVVHVNKNIKDDEGKILCEQLNAIKEKHGVDVVLMPIGYTLGDDMGITKLKSMEDGFVQIKKKLAPYDMMSVIANAKFYIGASLHGCVTSTAFKIPNIVYNYSKLNKIEGFLSNVKRDYAALYDPKKLAQCYDEVASMEMPDIQKPLQDIEEHFQKMAEVIKEGRKKEAKISNETLDEIIYNESVYSKEAQYYKKITEQKDVHIKNIEATVVDRENKLQTEKAERKAFEENANTKIKQLETQITEKDDHISNLQGIIETYKKEIENLRKAVDDQVKEKEAILNSTSYKITKPLRKVASITKKK